MADVETLTEGEREDLGAANSKYDVGCKALRILDALAERIARARKLASEPRPVGSPEARLAADVRRALDG